MASQALAFALVAAFLGWTAHNASVALAQRNIDVDFGFLLRPAGFDIPFRLIDWDTSDSYGRALLVAVLNTALASAVAIAGATALGVLVALMRLSSNALARFVARGFVELVRNTPQLLQIVFWYVVLLQSLPAPRASMSLGHAVFLNVRGLLLPAPDAPWFISAALGALLLGVLGPLLVRRGRLWFRLAAAGVLAASLLNSGYSLPMLRGFNFVGGWRLPPELLALAGGVAIYTSAFVAENVRASIEHVSRGQIEAARGLGLSPGRTMRLVVLPQALRTLVPPLTSQYLNAIKSTTLGAGIAYPELLQVFARTVLNQSGRAIEAMGIVLAVFLVTSLLVSGAMGRWNRRLQRQGR